MKSKKGFTIIEVVLVLAIAGLIFLMVFVALPNMQRNQRDTQRRQDYADLFANVNTYIADHKGSLPSVGTHPKGQVDSTNLINSDGTDPSGQDYSLQVVNNGDSTALSIGVVYVVVQAKCDGAAVSSNHDNLGSRDYAVYGYLESGSFCQSSK